MTRISGNPDQLPLAVQRLRRSLFGASVAVMTAACAVIVLWGTFRDAGAHEIAVPLAGAVLALSAELLCLDLAIRRVQRLVTASASRSDARRPVSGRPLARA